MKRSVPQSLYVSVKDVQCQLVPVREGWAKSVRVREGCTKFESVSVCRDSQLVMTGQANYAGIRRGLVLGGRGIPDPPRGFRRLVVSCFRIPSATVRTRRLSEFFGIEFAVVLFARTDGQCSSVRTACVRQYGLFVDVSTD